MTTTKAAVLRERGRPQPYARSAPLSIEELVLDDPGAGELRVKVGAAGLCHSDLSVIDGSRPRPLPMAIGHEGAGVVEAVGPHVAGFAPGDHVVFAFVPMCGRCAFCLSGEPALCENGAHANTAGTLLGGGIRLHGGGEHIHHHLGVSAFAERAVVAAASCVRIDPSLPLDRAALFGCALMTGVGAVLNTARVAPGTAVAVFGLGGVGLSTVMGAVLAGANPIVAIDRVAAKLELAGRLGATHALAAGDGTVAAIKEIVRGGVDFAFEAVGNAAVMADAYAATRRGGTTVAIGLPHPEQKLSIPAVSIVAEGRRIVGSYMGSAVPVRDIPRLIALHQAGRLPVERLQSGTITLDGLNAAFDQLAAGEAVRQVLVF